MKERFGREAGSRGRVVRQSRLPVGEILCRWEAHERHRHETRPEGLGAEQGVKRLRKPGGAAQPGFGSLGVGRCPEPHTLEGRRILMGGPSTSGERERFRV
jgi:hypothetical protein